MFTVHCFHSEIIVNVTEYLAIRPSSAPGNWGRGPGYIRDSLKIHTMSPSINFNNIVPQLTCVVGVV